MTAGYIDNVSITGLGQGCISDRTPVVVRVRECCLPSAAFNYLPNNTTAVLTNYCYLNPNDNFFHFYSPITPTRLLFTMMNVNPAAGNPVVTLEQIGGPVQNTADPGNCDPGPLAPEQFFEMERTWDVQLNGATVNQGGARVRFYYPTIEETALTDMVNAFLATYAGCNYGVDVVEWFKSAGRQYVCQRRL